MTGPLALVLLFIGVLITFPIGWRIGYRAGQRSDEPPSLLAWNEDVDQALAVFQDAAASVTPADWSAAMQRAGGSVSYLRHRRDKLN